ncbi:protein FAM208B [Patagioenas fasciata monilis]|uniref:Protein FAM208B n=1 Tax=Patagioenas fasciata monilis TaxID=372326 RepID=A0A1V4JXQ3_PATFA|nr:protein FAM208B [Patagioenas fasciata monilis]
MLKSAANSPPKPHAKNQAENEWNALLVLPGEVSSQCHGADNQKKEIYPGGVADLCFDLKGNNYESHALNLLADLALGSCISSLIPMDSKMIAVSCSPPSDSTKEQQSLCKYKSSRVTSDHEYHRVDKLVKGATSPCKVLPNQKLPHAEKIDLNDSASVPTEKNPGIFSKNNSENPSPPKPLVLPLGETQEAAEVNKHSLISAEHSYASQMPEHPKKHMYPRGAPYPGPAPSRNGTRSARAGPLVGKVLPFRHQNSTHAQRPFEAVAMRRRSGLLSSRMKEDFAKSHTVNICGEAAGDVRVTCHWEGEYLFTLDSRYTNDALEKTVIRALHGPWDPDLPDDVEEMKLILHMWVALFYSKPSKLLSSTRKVVEHSNPKKYVSINSSGGLMELSDDGEDCFGLETCPADSRSDPDQTPSSSLDHSTHCQGPFHAEENPADSQSDADGTPGVVDSTVSSSSGELPCGEEEEPSSTSCPESLSLPEHTNESLAVKDRQTAAIPEEHVCDVSPIAAEEQPKEGLMDTTITPSPSDELGDANKPQAAPGRKNSHGQAPNSRTTPQSDAPSALHGHREQQKSQWAAGSGGGPGPPKDTESAGDAGHCTEVEDKSWATSDGPQRACDLMPLEAHPKSVKPDGAGEKGRESQDPFGHPEKEEEVQEVKEKEDSEYENTVLGPVNSAFLESGDADMEHEHGEQKPENLASPKDFDVPGESPVPSPAALASPCPGRSTPGLSDGTGTGTQGLPGETAPNLDTPQEPWEALATPNAETKRVDLTHAATPANTGSDRDNRLMLLLPSDPSLVLGAQPNSINGKRGPAGETLGDSSEQKDEDRAPSAERWEPAGSKTAGTAVLESPCSQGQSLTVSPDSSSVCLMSLDGAADPGAAPKEREAVANIPSPLQSNSEGSSHLSQSSGGNIDADLALLSTGELNQEGNKVLVEERRSSPSANQTEVLGKSSGAGDSQGFAFDCAASAGDSEGGESDDAASERTRGSLPRRTTTFEEMIADLCSTLRFHLRSVAKEACAPPGMFYVVETGKEPFFARVKTLLQEGGRVEMEPSNFCRAKHPDTDRLLVVIRNEDISSHIHNVPCLLQLKRCPNVVFAGVDNPEDITACTYQELFHAGGFVVSDDEVLETITLGQLKEVVKVLEKLNRSGRWKWLLHYKESKKLREDVRVDANAHKKHLMVKSYQGADLIEVLPFHACDARSSPKSEHVECLLNLQVQRVSARFAVYLTEKPGLSREVLESKGILVADVNTFLWTVPKAAAPFRRSYW